LKCSTPRRPPRQTDFRQMLCRVAYYWPRYNKKKIRSPLCFKLFYTLFAILDSGSREPTQPDLTHCLPLFWYRLEITYRYRYQFTFGVSFKYLQTKKLTLSINKFMFYTIAVECKIIRCMMQCSESVVSVSFRFGPPGCVCTKPDSYPDPLIFKQK
jgi:hypothetical protein